MIQVHDDSSAQWSHLSSRCFLKDEPILNTESLSLNHHSSLSGWYHLAVILHHCPELWVQAFDSALALGWLFRAACYREVLQGGCQVCYWPVAAFESVTI